MRLVFGGEGPWRRLPCPAVPFALRLEAVRKWHAHCDGPHLNAPITVARRRSSSTRGSCKTCRQTARWVGIVAVAELQHELGSSSTRGGAAAGGGSEGLLRRGSWCAREAAGSSLTSCAAKQ